MDKVEKSEGPKLFNDAIGEWPNYIRLVLPILYNPIESSPPLHSSESTSPVQWLYTNTHASQWIVSI